jgi:hypothetical protein
VPATTRGLKEPLNKEAKTKPEPSERMLVSFYFEREPMNEECQYFHRFQLLATRRPRRNASIRPEHETRHRVLSRGHITELA